MVAWNVVSQASSLPCRRFAAPRYRIAGFACLVAPAHEYTRIQIQKSFFQHRTLSGFQLWWS
jgi:hypothetical protein